MLLLDSRTWEIEGITVFPDHADPLQYYYMPLAPHLTTVRDPGAGNAEIPQFSLIRFRGRAGTGGFLNFDVNVGASQQQLDDLRRTIQQEERLRDLPRIAPVPLVGGKVRLLMLGKQSGDEAGGDGGPGPQFVLKIDHSAHPSLYGNNQAAFSVRLDAAGVTTVERSLDGEILPIAVVYSLDFLGLRPAYAIRLNIDWERVQTHLDERFSFGFLFASSEIATTVDELVENRAIVLESDTFVTESEENEGVLGRRDAALAQVRAMITEAFFEPSLPPLEPGGEEDWEKALRIASGVAGAVALGPAAMLASSAYFSYTHTDYRRVDRKILNVNFSERIAIQRSIHPQGHLAGLFRLLRDTPVPRSRFVLDVDLDDPWFERRRLQIFARANFEQDRIGSINVQTRYGHTPQNVLLTQASPNGSFDWTSVLQDGAMARPVQVQYEVNFAGVAAAERPLKLISDPFECEVENLEIDPRELYTISAVQLVAIEFPWDVYPTVEVHLRYVDETVGIHQNDVFLLNAQRQDAVWRMFVLDPRQREYAFRLVYRAANHRDVDTGWKTADEPQITLRDPFPRKHNIQIVPNVNWDQVDRCFVDLRYEDRENNVFVDQSFDFVQGDTPKTFSVSLENPQHKQVFFKAIFLFRDGRMVEIPESTTLDNRIFLRPDMRGRRIVEFYPPDRFADRRLRRVLVDVRFEDFQAGLSFADSFAFDDEEARSYFEFDYVDEARARYEVRVTYLFTNGLERSVDWESANASVFRVKAP